MPRKTFSDYKKNIDNDIRTIIHYGINVACYKFPFLQTILDYASRDITHIKREELAKPFVEKIIKHMKKNSFQGNSEIIRNGTMLKNVKNFIDGKINMERLLLVTEKEGFKYVVGALPIVGHTQIIELYKDEMKTNKQIILTDNLLKFAKNKNLVNLLSLGTDTRWDLQQRSWETKNHPETLIEYNEQSGDFFEWRFNNRHNITSSKPTLINYQGDVCFYCRKSVFLENCEVEHFIPLDLAKRYFERKNKKLKYNLNNIGNLVNACEDCNGPNGKWHLYIPSKEYWHELHARNEQICNSDKPLEKTIQSNLGMTSEERHQKLVKLKQLCNEFSMQDWKPKKTYGELHYYRTK